MTRAVAEALGLGLTEAEELKRSRDLLTSAENDRAGAAVRVLTDTLLMEIRRSVDYYKTTFREKDVDGALLTGGVSLMRGLGEYCAQALELQVELDQPFDGLSCKETLIEEFGPVASRFSAAIGLALRKE